MESRKRRRSSHDSDDAVSGDDSTPLHKLRAFGSALRGGRVKFVPEVKPSSENPSTLTEEDTARKGARVADFYLDTVLGKTRDERKTQPPAIKETHKEDSTTHGDAQKPIAEDQEPVADDQELVAGDQNPDVDDDDENPVPLNVPYDLGPPAFDRSSRYFKQLRQKGFDPDTRLGLGAKGNEGRLYPVKASEKVSKTGVGFEAEQRKRRQEAELSGKPPQEPEPKKGVPLNAKQMRERVLHEKRVANAMEQEFSPKYDALAKLNK